MKSNANIGWNTYVKSYQLESKFWCAIHQSAGTPNSGALHDIARHTKMQYHYAVRRLRRATEKLQNDDFVKSITNKGGGSIFTELKKFRGSTKKCSNNIDGNTGSADIANHFANIYSDLYSKVELSDKFESFCESINGDIKKNHIKEVKE